MSTNLRIILHGHAQRFATEELLRQFGASFEPGESSAAAKEADKQLAATTGIVIEATLAELPATYELHSVCSPEATSDVQTSVRRLDQANEPRVYTRNAATADLPRNHEIKRQLWQALSDITKKHFPWGSLTGVHPTHVVQKLLQTNDEAATLQRLTLAYGVSPPKASLALEAAVAEQAVLSCMREDEMAVYVDIPFCPSRCSYCSFALPDGCGTAPRFEEAYVEAVLRELKQRYRVNEPSSPRQVKALYIGGGTPAALSAEGLRRLLFPLCETLEFAEDAELTFEAGRADAIDAEKLAIVKAAGFNKLCINPQTLHDDTLKRVNRRHTVAELDLAYEAARACGFESINMDLIAGLPGEDEAMVAYSVEGLIERAPEAITVHTLALKRSSQMHETKRVQAGRAPRLLTHAAEDPMVSTMVASAHATLHDAGYLPYYLYRQKMTKGGLENTGFARPGHESIYNVAMMSDQKEILALGAGASSKRLKNGRVKRSYNKRGIKEYIAQY